MVWHLHHCDPNDGTEVARRAGIELEKAWKLEQLPNRPAPQQDRERTIE